MLPPAYCLDARASGHADLKTLRGLLSKGAGRTVYRIALRRRGPDPRIALRAAVPSAADMDRIEARMGRLRRSLLIGHHARARLPGPDRAAVLP